ncbi:MAG: DNA-formamidopyrimidine glycosylase [Alphaproteobacteria bacterium]|nr:DNA-formamidopyrimidine glycosylase [Alphaproteobacteria bacterium]
MPELPEVEIMTRALGRWTVGRRVTAVEAPDPGLPRAVEDGLPLERLVGATVDGVSRRAKYSLLHAGSLRLVLHYRMTGKPVRLGPGEARPGTRLVLHLGEARVAFVDPRRLGDAWLLPDAAMPAFWAARSLGPEPWPDRHDGAWWQARLAGLRGPIKPALLRQDRVAGLGNICAAEALWRAGIDPRTPVPDLSPAQWDALAEAVPALIAHVLAEEEPSVQANGELDYVNAGGPNPFDVYGRAGEPCRRCGATLVRIAQAGRGTWWCPGCQH